MRLIFLIIFFVLILTHNLITMNELVTQTGAILGQATELLKIPAIGGAVTGLFGWLGNVITKKSAKEKLEFIKQNNADEETIKELQGILKYEIEDNKELQGQLEEQIKKIDLLMETAGVKNITKTNTVIVSGTSHITAVDINKSTITINR